ncbi:MAG: hypothetical protein P8179_19700 [Candidatus Thiodiazotropha sp.]|jgi:hypothetical protein
MEYYPVKYKLNYKNHFIIWCGNDIDHVLVINGFIAVFQNLTEINKYASANSLKLNSKPISYELDKIKLWCKNPTSKINCVAFLDSWNLFGDIAASFPQEHEKFESLTKKYLSQYNKLFYGCNLDPIRRNKPKYYPIWSNSDINYIKSIFRHGFKLINQRCRTYTELRSSRTVSTLF